jgi:hypothetical protein
MVFRTKQSRLRSRQPTGRLSLQKSKGAHVEIRLDTGGGAVAQPVLLAFGHAESPGLAGFSGMIGKAEFEGTGAASALPGRPPKGDHL